MGIDLYNMQKAFMGSSVLKLMDKNIQIVDNSVKCYFLRYAMT